MNNLYLYNKYVIKPQLLLKFPKEKNNWLIEFGIRKICMYMYLLDLTKNYYMFLYNICILMRILFNKYLNIKKVNKYYSLNRIHLQISIEDTYLYIFIDVFKNFLLDSFEFYNMGLNYKNFDIFGNFIFEFNYCDPIFTTRNVILVWSPLNKIKFIFYFNSINKEYNKLYLRYLGLQFRYLKKKIKK